VATIYLLPKTGQDVWNVLAVYAVVGSPELVTVAVVRSRYVRREVFTSAKKREAKDRGRPTLDDARQHKNNGVV
jgi:hypothetical protein